MVKSGAGAIAALLQCGVQMRTRGPDSREESKEVEDADDGVRLIAQGQRGPNDIWITAKFALPQTITQHHDLAAAKGKWRC